jgi:hypothetical protein
MVGALASRVSPEPPLKAMSMFFGTNIGVE